MGASVSWFTEKYTPHDLRSHALKKTILETKTPFQHAVLADSYSFGHPKTRLVIEDAWRFLKHTTEKFDIIISDLPTPRAPGDPVAELYGLDFYRQLKKRLQSGGLFVAQAGSGHWLHIQFNAQLQ